MNRFRALFTSLAALLVTSAGAQTHSVVVGWKVASDWGAGANCTLYLTNTGATTITNNLLELDFVGHTISPYNNVLIASHVGDHYALTNQNYYSKLIAPGATFFFDMQVNPGALAGAQPTNILINGLPLAGAVASPALSIADVSAPEGNSGSNAFSFVVTLAPAATNTVTVNFATASGSATSGSDFNATNGTLLFAPGVTQQVVSVYVLGDTAEEMDETFSVALASATNASLGRATATGTILNDDVTLRLSVNDAAIYEGNSATTPATFTVSLNVTSAAPVTVQAATADVSAVAGADYLATNVAVTFNPGELTKSVQVRVVGNTNQQLTRTFALNLSSPVGAIIQDGQGIGTILDDDGGFSGKPQSGPYSYAEALQKSLFFYECQRAGALPADNRVTWRGHSATNDGSDVGRDLAGGWFDAGDHVKFGLPMAASATLLAWGGLEYPAAYAETGQQARLLDNLKWVCDYFIKCHVLDTNGDTLEFYGQVGNGSADHAWWGAPEVMTMARPAYKVTRAAPGSDLTGETAAALAACSMLFQSSSPAYASNLLAHAKKLYAFADTYRGKYSDAITDAAAFYNSWSGYQDELMWGGLWLYRATGDTNYLAKAQTAYNLILGGTPALKWTHSWDDKSYGALVLFSQLTTNAAYRVNAERWLNWWTVGRPDGRITYTPGGLAWLDQWGSLRYADNTAFLALIYSDRVNDYTNRYRNFAISQINYTLGANPLNRSFVCGFGVNPPASPHHRAAHGSWNNNINNPPASRHVLYGALVGGPGNTDNYTDARDNYTANEVACDYNAAFSGALARLYELYGGYTQPDFPVAETPTNQFFVEASINQSGTYFTEIRALLNNQSAWPARASTNLRYRYFVNLSELYAAGGTSNNVTITANALNGGSISGLIPWDVTNRIYYVELRYDGVSLIPGGSTSYRREAQFRLTIPNSFPASAWNPANDWSYAGLLAGNLNVTNTGRIPTYENAVRLEGGEPPAPDLFAVWRSGFFSTAELADPAISGADADPDGDGFTNRQEFLAGTHPRDASSAMMIGDLVRDVAGFHLFFPTVSGKLYQVLRSDTLNPGAWSVLNSNVSGTGAIVEIVDPAAGAVPARFYRVLIEP